MNKNMFISILIILVAIACASNLAACSTSTDSVKRVIPPVEEMTAYQVVLDAGFPVDMMDEDTVLAIYNNIKDADDVVVETTTKYLTEVDEENIRPGNIPSSDLSFTISAGKAIVGGKITSVSVFVYYEWAKSKPIWLLTDAVSVNWSSQFTFQANSFTAKHYRDGKLATSLTKPSKAEQVGLGWYVELTRSSVFENGDAQYGSGHFFLLPIDTMNDGTTNPLIFNAQYGHKTVGLNSINLGISDSGPSAGVSIGNADDTTSASNTIYYKK
jgi:hypothetical protein